MSKVVFERIKQGLTEALEMVSGDRMAWPPRCHVTGNPWGTDTVTDGYKCPCETCTMMERGYETGDEAGRDD